jgi:CDP-glucose 4,6-dehydratase
MSYGDIYRGQTVLITGHTGFKGTWLSLYLLHLGAQVIGYALPPPTTPSLFGQTDLVESITHHEADIRDLDALVRTLEQHRPAYIFHLAAQPLVLQAYQSPVETYDINVMGSVKLLEAIRYTSTRARVIMVITDKTYKNTGAWYGYRETDPLGGHDPYSASKAAMDIAVQSYRAAFFPPSRYADHGVALASVRAGNVIGGGDWAADRIVPDAIRAFMSSMPLNVRHPRALRPWQHVLDCLSGYLWLGAHLTTDPPRYADDWNFGPLPTDHFTVAALVDQLALAWGDSATWIDSSGADAPHEAESLHLSIDKAIAVLRWRPVWDFFTTVQHTVQWYRAAQHADSAAVRAHCHTDIAAFEHAARDLGVAWAVDSVR